jgi:hypothetical protein
MTTFSETAQTEQNQDINLVNKTTSNSDFSRPSPLPPILSGLNDALGIMAASVNAELTQIIHQLADKSSDSDNKKIHDSLLSAKMGLKEIISMIGVFDEALAMIAKSLPQAPYEPSLFDNAFNMLARANGTLGVLCHLFSDSNSDQVDDNDLYYAIDSIMECVSNIAIDVSDFHNTQENQQA